MYNHILIAIDPDTKNSWEQALPEAVKLARAHSAKLHVMTVVPDYGSSLVASFFPEGFETNALKSAKVALHKVAEPLIPADLPHQFITAQHVNTEPVNVVECVVEQRDEIGSARERVGFITEQRLGL